MKRKSAMSKRIKRSKKELLRLYDEFLDSYYAPVEIYNVFHKPSEVVLKMDSTAYHDGFYKYLLATQGIDVNGAEYNS